MTQFKSTFKLGEIVETIYPVLSQEIEYSLITHETAINEVVNFCIDSKGKVRISGGMVAYDEESEQNDNYVPQNRFCIETGPWNSHSLYFEIELPNPADDFEHYKLIRNAMLAELKVRLDRQKKNAQSRHRRENKTVK